MFEPWLSARDAVSMRDAWSRLAPKRHELPDRGRQLTLHGAAELAAAMLGERASWIVECDRTTPDYHSAGASDVGFALDDAWDMTSECSVTWDVWERPGVQVVRIGAGSLSGPPEGGSHTVVRVYAGDRAASVVIDTNIVSTVGAVDLAPLDLLGYSGSFKLAEPATIELARGVLAHLAAEHDAHFDTSAQWPLAGGTSRQAFPDGERTVAITESGGHINQIRATAEPAWGTQIVVQINAYDGGTNGGVYLRLPTAAIDRVLARLGVLEGRSK